MAIAHEGDAVGVSGNGDDTAVVTVPAGGTDDLVIIYGRVVSNSITISSISDDGPSATWTSRYGGVNTGPSPDVDEELWTSSIITSASSFDVTVTFSGTINTGSAERGFAFAVRYSGVDSISEASSNFQSANGTGIDAGSLNIASGNEHLLFAKQQPLFTPTTFTQPSNFSADVDYTDITTAGDLGRPRIAVSRNTTDTGASDPSVTSSRSWGGRLGVALELVPASGGGGVGANAVALTMSALNPTVTPGAAQVSANSVAMSLSVLEPSVSPPTATVAANAVAMTLGVLEPSVVPGAVSVSSNVVPLSLSVLEPSVAPGAVSVSANVVSAPLTVPSPSVDAGGATIEVLIVDEGTTGTPQTDTQSFIDLVEAWNDADNTTWNFTHRNRGATPAADVTDGTFDLLVIPNTSGTSNVGAWVNLDVPTLFMQHDYTTHPYADAGYDRVPNSVLDNCFPVAGSAIIDDLGWDVADERQLYSSSTFAYHYDPADMLGDAIRVLDRNDSGTEVLAWALEAGATLGDASTLNQRTVVLPYWRGGLSVLADEGSLGTPPPDGGGSDLAVASMRWLVGLLDVGSQPVTGPTPLAMPLSVLAPQVTSVVAAETVAMTLSAPNPTVSTRTDVVAEVVDLSMTVLEPSVSTGALTVEAQVVTMPLSVLSPALRARVAAETVSMPLSVLSPSVVYAQPVSAEVVALSLTPLAPAVSGGEAPEGGALWYILARAGIRPPEDDLDDDRTRMRVQGTNGATAETPAATYTPEDSLGTADRTITGTFPQTTGTAAGSDGDDILHVLDVDFSADPDGLIFETGGSTSGSGLWCDAAADLIWFSWKDGAPNRNWSADTTPIKGLTGAHIYVWQITSPLLSDLHVIICNSDDEPVLEIHEEDIPQALNRPNGTNDSGWGETSGNQIGDILNTSDFDGTVSEVRQYYPGPLTYEAPPS